MTTFAFVFPGQGSQSVGMLDAWDDHPVVLETLQEASDALGEDVAQLIHEGPKEALAMTTNTQPVMLVSAVAAYRAWLAEGGAIPSVVAGHSLGEYSALVASGVLTLSQAAPLVRLRPGHIRRRQSRSGRSGELQRRRANRDRGQQGGR
jgi:[acyl-carrier-protein] S-malonyltransferase